MPSEEAKTYKWYLKYSGREDSPMFRAAIKHLNTFPLWRDSEAHVVTFDEYTELVVKDEIALPQSYWNVGEEEVGFVVLTAYRRYANTWNELIDPAFEDFQDGWRACEQHAKEEAAKTVERKPLRRKMTELEKQSRRVDRALYRMEKV
jgi:hypothetical protein